MRNGNLSISFFAWKGIITCSYPTYEEWKLLNIAHIYLGYSVLVLILPMRNGNTLMRWSGRYNLACVLILPMRNGNSVDCGVYGARKYTLFLSYLWGMETWLTLCGMKEAYIVLILPMRNGNSEAIVRTVLEALAVLILPMRNGNMIMCCTVMLCGMFLSYLWGMETISSLAIWIVLYPVLILPMRNGN